MVAAHGVGEKYKVARIGKGLAFMEEHRAKGGSGAAVDRKERRIFLFRIEACRLHHIAVQLQSLVRKGKLLYRKDGTLCHDLVVEGGQLFLLFSVKAVALGQSHFPHAGEVYLIPAQA